MLLLFPLKCKKSLHFPSVKIFEWASSKVTSKIQDVLTSWEFGSFQCVSLYSKKKKKNSSVLQLIYSIVCIFLQNRSLRTYNSDINT